MSVDPPALINVHGRADRRPLSSKAREKHVSNEALAHKRATSVANWIAGVTPGSGSKDAPPSKEENARTQLLMARTHVDVAGVRYSNSRNPQALEQDRSVDIEAFWPRQLPINSPAPAEAAGTRLASVGLRLNSEGMDPAVALAVLSLFVALSAYLATVGFFMRERVSELKKRISEVKIAAVSAQGVAKDEYANMLRKLERRRDTTQTRLNLLPIADLPMIFAALLLALHLFFFLSTAWLRVSIVLATFAAMILVMQHAGVWWKTGFHVFNPKADDEGGSA
jgi:uncharacterized membrane protein (DUF106 family)